MKLHDFTLFSSVFRVKALDEVKPAAEPFINQPYDKVTCFVLDDLEISHKFYGHLYLLKFNLYCILVYPIHTKSPKFCMIRVN